MEADDLACLVRDPEDGRRPRVMLSHRNLVHRLATLDAHIHTRPGEAWLSAPGASAVPADLELLWALARGLQVVFPVPPPARLLATRIDAALQSGRGVTLPPLTRAPEEKRLLSFAQQRLWFIDQLHPGSPTYNMPVALRLEGRLDTGALERAFTELVRRHESLRTTFRDEQGMPIQVIASPAPFPLPVVDLSGREDREAEALRLASEDARCPFNLSTGPLMRATLLRLGEHEHVLLLAIHHIVSDGWSMGVLVREMAALYRAFCEGLPSPLAELPIQYADYAVWQRSWLKDAVLAEQLAWWRQHLDGAPSALELPTDFPRPAIQTFRGAAVPVQLSKDVSTALKALCQREGVTPFMALLAAFQTLLARYSGQDEVLVGSPIAGRRFAELESLIGFFINTLSPARARKQVPEP